MSKKITTVGQNPGRVGAVHPGAATEAMCGGRCLPYPCLKGMFAMASGQCSPSAFTRTRLFAHLILLLFLLLPLGVTHAESASIAPGTTSPMPTTEFVEDHDDLAVKVMGGQVAIRRAYMDKQWYANRTWVPLKLTFDSIDGSVKEISRLGNVFKKTADGVYTSGKRLYIRQTPTGFRWANRNGDWIDYDAQGNIIAYGDRNDVKVSFEYQTTNDVSRLTGLFDHFGTKVLTFTYTGNQLTAIQDYTNRKVQYRYDLDGNLTQVIDVLGNIWNYIYTVNEFTDYQCTIEYEYINGQLVKVVDRCDTVIVRDGFRLTSRTDPEGRTTTLAFAGNGFNAGETYADGTKLQYTYDYDKAKKQHYLKEISPSGKITERWYDADGNRIREVINGRTTTTLLVEPRRRTESNERGLVTIYDLDEWDNPTKMTYSDGTSVGYSYDPLYSNVTQKTDERGTVTKYDYDAKGNLIRLTEAVGLPEQRSTEYAYDPYGNKTQEKRLGDINTQEAIFTYEYDTRGNATRITDPEINPTAYTYDVMGNVKTMTDGRGKVWTKTYDNAGRLSTQVDPLGHTTTYTYDKIGQRIKEKDAANNETIYRYDAKNNPITVTDPYGGVRRLEYNTNSQPIKWTEPGGKSELTTYDLDGRVVETVDGNGNAIKYIYGDAVSGLDGLLIKKSYPSYSQEFKYDARNRLTQSIDILDVNVRHTVQTAYDAAGNRTSSTDQQGRIIHYDHDALGRIIKVIDPAQGITAFTYDNRDNIVTVKNPIGQVHRFVYDRRSLKIEEVRSASQTIRYAYNSTLQLATITDSKGHVRQYSYDDAGRRIEERHYLTSADTTPVKTIAFSYNVLDALVGYDDGVTRGVQNYDDKQLRKIGETMDYGAFSLTYSYAYYANGLKKSLTYPDGTLVNYTYDTNQQLSSMQLPVGSLTVSQYRWYAPAQVTLPGGAVRTQEYDALMRITDIRLKDSAQSEILNYHYTYDKTYNITSKTTEHGNYGYAYDDLNRLTSASNPGPLAQEGYSYNLLGNRISDSNIPGSWNYNANGQLIFAGGTTFDYDENGNTIGKIEDDKTTTFVYDTRNRLSEVKDQNSDLIARYVYDPYGRRLWKEIGNHKIYFLYADEGLIGEYDTVGGLIKAYGYKPNSTWSTDPVFLKTNNQYFFYHNDHLGTPQKITALNGTIVWSAKSQAFGKTTVDSSSTITNNLRFPGQYEDEETSLHYNRNRYYNPRTGRYLQQDPIGLIADISLYKYALLNPNIYSDPLGLLTNCTPYAYGDPKHKLDTRNRKPDDWRFKGFSVEITPLPSGVGGHGPKPRQGRTLPLCLEMRALFKLYKNYLVVSEWDLYDVTTQTVYEKCESWGDYVCTRNDPYVWYRQREEELDARFLHHVRTERNEKILIFSVEISIPVFCPP
jgi:large repetitive protein